MDEGELIPFTDEDGLISDDERPDLFRADGTEIEESELEELVVYRYIKLNGEVILLNT